MWRANSLPNLMAASRSLLHTGCRRVSAVDDKRRAAAAGASLGSTAGCTLDYPGFDVTFSVDAPRLLKPSWEEKSAHSLPPLPPLPSYTHPYPHATAKVRFKTKAQTLTKFGVSAESGTHADISSELGCQDATTEPCCIQSLSVISALSGRKLLTVRLPCGSLVLDVKEALEKETGIKASQQCLIDGTRKLSDYETIDDVVEVSLVTSQQEAIWPPPRPLQSEGRNREYLPASGRPETALGSAFFTSGLRHGSNSASC
eukprot:gnl/TRDRNA2_/TRDRNA2_188924_c0_seq1.p1 gnl/TRDRNA2_/TRDRNA2_188924_c0~~gnl/TRDRNA2_/TRDRNA2_188924_c0_seq1.p1  ORF type:complete len:258 (+),score=25.90 gnl/TRDRNA2_/TRDRNA2_188924_c0_seq1:61-834(+)